MSSLANDAPSPRLCIIVKWPDFEGYGFNLHAEKSKPGQYIGKVDENSPAETAGLLEDDRIIEVNGVNIANENHKQVVQRIKTVPNETRLLVVDPAADKYYKSKNIVVRGTQDNVIVRSSAREETEPTIPDPAPQATATVSNGHHEEVDNRSVSSAASSSAASEASTQPQHAPTVAEPDNNTVEEVTPHDTMEEQNSRSPSPPPAEETGKSCEDITINKEDVVTVNISEKLTEDNVDSQAEDSLPETSETSAPQGEEPCEKSEEVIPETDHQEHEVQQETKEEEEKVEGCDDEKQAIAIPPPSPEQESDLEAEYDNVEIDGDRRAEIVTSQTTSDSRRLSVSSDNSHSSHGSDTARTDTPTQSPMSTSPTPPPSLEPVPEPVHTSPPPPATTTTSTASTTTNNPSPKSQPVSNKNTYNSSGLNLNMSAAEMRAMLARKKKADPRKETVDLKTKYEIIQNM